MASILLIDDQAASLADLRADVERSLILGEADILEWLPQRDDASDPKSQWESKVRDDTLLVVTDHDLSEQGQLGLFGPTIVRWAQQRLVAAAVFSRGHYAELPQVPGLFELKIAERPTGEQVAALFRGFRDIAAKLELVDNTAEITRSPAALLAHILGEQELEYQFAEYAPRLAAASGPLMDLVEQDPTPGFRRRLTAYALGHLLVNSILRFPGPLLSLPALCGYVGTTMDARAILTEFLKQARYTGPFSGPEPVFWRRQVDQVLEPHFRESSEITTVRRDALESVLPEGLPRHSCPRCGGINGGYFCPFTRRAVCERADCSVGSNSWLPPGASVCRIEHDFFEEWAPVLGF